jgi:high affinity Mn2+ porin
MRFARVRSPIWVAVMGMVAGLASTNVVAAEEENGWEVGGKWLVVGQRLSGSPSVAGEQSTQFSTRLDLEMEKALLGLNGRFFSHIRSGMGHGVQPAASPYTSAVNSTVFSKDGDHLHDFKAIVAQAWVELNFPLFGQQGFSAVVGKIDPAVFFDQNDVAGDEAEKFLNNLFVHSPHLDTGGEYGIDENGFSPGAIVQYQTQNEKTANWAYSLGVFGSGNGENLKTSSGTPFTIAQVRYFGNLIGELPGSVAAYRWNNPRAANALDDTPQKHAGWGISADQALSKNFSLFGRLSYGLRGVRAFDRAVTMGAELRGEGWGRPTDHIGLAVGSLRPDPIVTVANAATVKNERNVELMYSFAVNEDWKLTADYQTIDNPGGDPAQTNMRVVGVRSSYSF